ncbi:MAG: nicotinate (nicotinamide) nucleotide adenylyltransferase, partial [Gammaproteobacteria bacterium]
MQKNDAPTYSPLLGIFGGSFDPIHIGHLNGLWEITQKVEFDRLHIIPCGQSPTKKALQTTTEHRLAMLQLAIKHQPHWHIDECEIARGGNSYTIDTLKGLHEEFPHHNLCLIIGVDVAARLMEWRNWQQILSFANLIIMTRPDYALFETPWILELQRRTLSNPQQLHTEKVGGVYWQKITSLAISATQIRKLSSENKPPPFLVPSTVWDYIQ